MGSMHTGMEDSTKEFEDLAEFYAERARGGVGLIVTGGFSPTWAGSLYPGAGVVATRWQTRRHRGITEAVHRDGAAILLQLLHAGRYAYHPLQVSASRVKAPINPFKPWSLPDRSIRHTIDAFARSAGFAAEAGYDGVEIMGSEGYFINQFLARRTNRRTDSWGGSAAGRRRLAVEIVRRTREVVGDDFIIQYRMSLLDLVPDGQEWSEVLDLATAVQDAGATIINTGIGWHEARVPTIVTSVPRGAFVDVTAALKEHVEIPVAASNRINMPALAEEIVAEGKADLVSMARPLLADPAWVDKAARGRADDINTCIACNQACLDNTFSRQRVTCLVNPRAGHERDLVVAPAVRVRRIVVVGAGPAGLATATTLAERGHEVDLFEANPHIGGQFALAKEIPGKEEFAETIRYFTRRIEETGVRLHTSTRVDADRLSGFDEVVLATGVSPRVPQIPGVDHVGDSVQVITYAQLLSGEKRAGERVAVLGAGGIGVDVSEYLTHTRLGRRPEEVDLAHWMKEWGVTDPREAPGGLGRPDPEPSPRTVHLLQRKPTAVGRGLAKTTGWVHRASLSAKGVDKIAGVTYERIDEDGVHITVPGEDGARVPRTLSVDTVVLCTGQESQRELVEELATRGITTHVVGGADVAAELDAKRAIDQATRLAARL
ncbi:NADPH-dependent 2,4-dienoyl-CoA reductase [Mobilicoccus caccae]|uniref:NADPH-dependent 2,4-dienoyl-CoA reductase n=2 Tax=Mobilicoccus caccae TaxID=1859295 RepID=A0ABQ6IUR2_9MICO|nr:NADPH-dependent 2,4-dienoyl-CoA reductase [Mobilicoccus caccae]